MQQLEYGQRKEGWGANTGKELVGFLGGCLPGDVPARRLSSGSGTPIDRLVL